MRPLLSNPTSRCRLVCIASVVWLTAAQVFGVVFYDTADPNHNTTAPTGIYQDSGWQYEGVFGDNLGTVIGPQHFITAAHVSIDPNFVRLGIFTGGTDTSYAVDTTAFGGVGYYTVPGTDLRVYQITGTFSDWAELYSGSSEALSTAVLHGKGGERGSAVTLDSGFGPEAKGWLGTGTNRVPRWGTNQITGILPSALTGVGDLLVADFDALSGTDEAMLTGNDSGGGMFIFEGGKWKLAGVNYAVDGAFNSIPSDTGAFNGALFDMGGYFVGQGSTWDYHPDLITNDPQSLYASRVSPFASTLNTITGVPEPGSLLFIGVLVAHATMCIRKRRDN